MRFRNILRFVIFHRFGVLILFSFYRFEELRIEQGKTKSHIAKLIDRTPTVVQDWKLGKSEPNDEQLEIIARDLQTTSAYLRNETDEKEIPASVSADGPKINPRYFDLSPDDQATVDALIERLAKGGQ